MSRGVNRGFLLLRPLTVNILHCNTNDQDHMT